MNNEYYKEQIRQLTEVMEKSTEKKISFFQHLLLVSASIVGIVISLHTTNSESLYIRLVFLVSTTLLSLGALSLTVVLYDFSKILETLCQELRNDILDAMKTDRECKIVSADQRKRTLFLEKTSYILLTLGFVLQITYTGLMAFEPTKAEKKTERKELIIKHETKTIDNQAPNR